MQFSENDIQRIQQAAEGRLLDIISDYIQLRKGAGSNHTGECPVCHGKGKFSFSESKQVFKCFACGDVKGKTGVAFLMSAMRMSYPEALETLAKRFNVLLEDKPQPARKKPAAKMKKKSKDAKGQNLNSFCARMLEDSGLTFADVTANVYRSDDKSAIFQAHTFRPGTLDDQGNIVEGDDVIIEYYDLDGMPVLYTRQYAGKSKKTVAAPREYFRVRWQFPDEHLDKNGESYKYKSPAGSGTPIYIPEFIRKAYKEDREIPRLYIQEGEKKAEKACKHGIPSIAVSGIQNLGQRGSLPEDLVRIITKCKVAEVAFLFDSDWNDLSRNIKLNVSVDIRPRCFFSAAKNFKDYMRMMRNRGISLDIYVGHVNRNEAGDKGIDDLLVNTLRGKEPELLQDLDFAANEKSGIGRYVTLHRITTWTDQKLLELWNLNDAERFAKAHADILKELPEFRIGRYSWKFDDNGEVVPAEPYEEDEKFWIETPQKDRYGCDKTDADGNVIYTVNYDYVAGKNFFQNRGIGRIQLLNGDYDYIHLQPPFVKKINVEGARDFIFGFAEQFCSRRVNNMLLQGGAQYVGDFQLKRLNVIEPAFRKPTRDIQYFYLRDCYWEITEQSVVEKKYESLDHHVWAEQRSPFDAHTIGHRLVTFSTDAAGHMSYKLSPEGQQCHFLRFLENASNFSWRKKPEEVSEEEQHENAIHLLSKLCAIGFMMMSFKDPNVARAIIAMDGKQSEVGESNGRSGKSLIGELIRNVMSIVYISGKKQDFFTDSFIWNDIDERTRLVFIDDVLQGFNFEFLFANITGDWTVNRKGGVRITYPFPVSPKIYIATNHAIKGSGSSFTDRQWLIAFSDFYNDTHKPLDDFGLMFFSEWDYEQWNLVWNMLATAVQLYLEHGVVQAPGDRLEQRKLRQEIGETLIAWADEYYSDTNHFNVRIARKDLYDSFKNYDPREQKFISATAFKKKLLLYIQWKGWVYNPQKYDSKSGEPLYFDRDGRPVLDDKSGGVEYITVGEKSGTDTGTSATGTNDMPFEPASDKIDF